MKYRQYRTELVPNDTQRQKINQWLGVNRFVYNLYLTRTLHSDSDSVGRNRINTAESALITRKKLQKPAAFLQWLKNEYIPQTNSQWIEDCPEDSLKETIWQAYRVCRLYRQGRGEKPHYYRKGRDGKISFRRHGKNDHVVAGRHFVEIPHLGRVVLKDKGYIPQTAGSHEIEKGHVALKDGKCWLNVQVGFPNGLPISTKKASVQKPVYHPQVSSPVSNPVISTPAAF